MPKYTFMCNCGVKFSRSLKMSEHPTHECPACKQIAPRLFEGFGFGFKASPQSAPGNSGVSKEDYPTADHAVGKDAEVKWASYNEREAVKKKVRESGGTQPLIRKNGPDYVEYEGGTPDLITRRKRLLKEAREIDAKKTA